MRSNPTVLRVAQYILLLVLLIPASEAAPADGASRAQGTLQLYGVVEDGGRNHRTAAANGKTKLICETGFNAVRHTVPWVLRQRELNNRDNAAIQNAINAARECGLTVILTIYPYHKRELNPKPPTTASEQRMFADFVEYVAERFPEIKHFEIGNESNWSFFWWPQFGPDGKDAAIRPYFSLLARTYDKLKTVNPEIVVIGGTFASMGGDDPNAERKRHSPTRSIELLGQYYRESGRTRPIMDWFSIHPYGVNSSEPPDTPHPNSTTIGFADYDKLVALLGEAFDGTAQEGSSIPILYSEYGVESAIPSEKSHLYRGAEPSRTKPVPEETQADYYRRALEMASCQRTVVGVLFFHVMDEASLDEGWQSGLYYADEKAKESEGLEKASQPLVKRAIQKFQKGGMRC